MVSYWRRSARRRWRRRRWRSCCFSRRGTQDTQPAQGIWSRARCCQTIYINPTSGHLVIIRPYIRKIQGWEFALLLFPLSLIIAHFKEQPRAICSHGSLKKQSWANPSRRSLQKSNTSELLTKKSDWINKKIIFSYVFDNLWIFSLLFPFVLPNSELLQSLFAQLLTSLFTKDLSVSELLQSLFVQSLFPRSLQNTYCERFACVTL